VDWYIQIVSLHNLFKRLLDFKDTDQTDRGSITHRNNSYYNTFKRDGIDKFNHNIQFCNYNVAFKTVYNILKVVSYLSANQKFKIFIIWNPE
jgi:hypothetical protein